METIKQLLLALGLLTSPVEQPPVACFDNCQPSPVAEGVIKHFEGYSPIRYRDAAGYDTIGFGHLIRPGEKIPEPLLGEAAERLLQQDIAPKAAAVNLYVRVPLFQGQFDGVLSWTYNFLKLTDFLRSHGAYGWEERQVGGSSAWTPMAPPGCARLSPALMSCPQAHSMPPPSVLLAPLTRPADLTTHARTIA